MNWSIRTRLAFYFALLVGVIVVLYSISLYGLISYSLENEFRRDLEHEGRWIAQIVLEKERAGTLATLADDIRDLDAEARMIDGKGTAIFDTGNADWDAIPLDGPLKSAAASSPVWRRTRLNGVPQELLVKIVHARPGRDFTLEMLASRTDVVQLRRTFSFWILVLVPVAMALAVAAGLLYARRALAPIEIIRRRADRIRPEDLTERLPLPAQKDELFHLTETLNRLLARIEEAFSQVKKFTTDASHELRLPVTVLKGALDVTLRRDRPQTDYREALEDMQEDVDRLARLVDDLLVLSRADAGRPIQPREEIDGGALLRELYETALTLARDKVTVRLGELPSAPLRGDPDALRRAILNVVHNAIKFTPAGGEVRLEGRTHGEKTVVLVNDTGPGITPEEQKKIFDRFFRTDEARAGDRAGSGLGLAIARATAEAHGGTLTVSSAPGQGSEFRFEIPNGTPAAAGRVS